MEDLAGQVIKGEIDAVDVIDPADARCSRTDGVGSPSCGVELIQGWRIDIGYRKGSQVDNQGVIGYIEFPARLPDGLVGEIVGAIRVLRTENERAGRQAGR